MRSLLQTVEDLGIADNTIFIFLADNGTDRDLYNNWGDGYSIRGGKGTMTDRGTHVPMIVRWPGHIQPGQPVMTWSISRIFFPRSVNWRGAPLPKEEIHGRSFLPQLLGKPGEPREWVHVQHKEDRHIRSREYILNNKKQLRPVVKIWESPAEPDQDTDPEKEQAARKRLQAVFEAWGNRTVLPLHRHCCHGITPLALLGSFLFGVLPRAATSAEVPYRPNIVLIMADDLGYGSLGCYGSKADQHARILIAWRDAGMRFTDFHSNGPMCTPTRAALMTGRYPQRCAWVG